MSNKFEVMLEAGKKAGATIESALEAGLAKAFAKDEVLPAAKLKPVLNAVKKEELKFSGVKFPTNGKVTNEEALQAVRQRKDLFGMEDTLDNGFEQRYDYVTHKPISANPNYVERVHTYAPTNTTYSLTNEQTAALQSATADNAVDTYNATLPLVIPELRTELATKGRVTTGTDVLARVQAMDETEQSAILKLYKVSDGRKVDSSRLSSQDVNAIREAFPQVGEQDLKSLHLPEFIKYVAPARSTEPASHYTSGHFGAVNDYLMHVRHLVEAVGPNATKSIIEIQSDIIAVGRQKGTTRYGANQRKALMTDLDYWEDAMSAATDTSRPMLEAKYAKFLTDNNLPREPIQDIKDFVAAEGSRPPVPYAETFFRRTLEREVVDSVARGLDSTRILLEPGELAVGKLNRKKNQAMYDVLGRSTVEKIAKEQGMGFNTHTDQSGNVWAELTHDYTGAEDLDQHVLDNVPLYSLVQLSLANRSTLPTNRLSQKAFEEQLLSANDEITTFYDDIFSDMDEDGNVELDGQLIDTYDVMDKRIRAVLNNTFTDTSVDVNMLIDDIELYYAHALNNAEDFSSTTVPTIDINDYVHANPEAHKANKAVNKISPSTSVASPEAIARVWAAQFSPKGFRKLVKPYKFNLYAAPSTLALAAGIAYNKGQDDAAVKDMLLGEGATEATMAQAMQDGQFISAAMQQGYTQDEAVAKLFPQDREGATVTTTPPKVAPEPVESNSTFSFMNAAKDFVFSVQEAKSAQDLVRSLEIVYPKQTSMLTEVQSYFGVEEATREVQTATRVHAQKIVDVAATKGLNLAWYADGSEGREPDTFYLVKADGTEVPVFDTFSSIDAWTKATGKATWNMRGELGIGTAAMIKGAQAGADVLSGMAPARYKPVAALVGGIGGGLLAGTVGTAAGSELDYLREAMHLNEKLSAEVALFKATTAGEQAALNEVFGYSAAYAFKGIRGFKDFIVAGNSKGALEMLRKYTYTTKEEGQDLIAMFNRLHKSEQVDPGEWLMKQVSEFMQGPSRKATNNEMLATIMSKPGAEAIVASVSQIDPVASKAIVRGIDLRAQDILKASEGLTDANVGKLMREDLANYTTDTKAFYQKVKDLAAQSPTAANYKFDYDKLMVDDALTSIGKNIEDDITRNKFTVQANRWKEQSSGRSFSDLLSLYKLVNEYTYSRKVNFGKNTTVMQGILGNIRAEINSGAKVAVTDSDGWLKMWDDANLAYSDMKKLEKNVLYKAITRPGIKQDVVVASLSKYINAVDSTYMDVVAKLPKKARNDAEGAIINMLVNKYAAGEEGGLRAVQFPMLAKELKETSFSSPEARQFRRAVEVFAEYFKNDIPIAQMSGGIYVPKAQTYLTSDISKRIEYEFATSVMNYARRLAPTQRGNTLSMVMKAAKVLENPRNSIAIKDLMQDVKGDVVIGDQLNQMALKATRDAADGLDATAMRVVLYGDGNVLSVKGDGAKQLIARHRIATTADVVKLAETNGIHKEDKAALDAALKERGYKAVQLGNEKVRLLK